MQRMQVSALAGDLGDAAVQDLLHSLFQDFALESSNSRYGQRCFCSLCCVD